MGQARKISQAMVVGAREDTRQIASTLIEESGFHVIEAESMDEAADLLTRHARKLTFVFAEAAPDEARRLSALVARNWPWVRMILSTGRDDRESDGLPSSAARLQPDWRPLDLLIEAERATH